MSRAIPTATSTGPARKPDAAILAAAEVFPEPRTEEPGSNVNGLRINHFFPWQIHPDGTEEETLNHIGRHELHDYFDRSFTDDPNLVEFIDEVSGRLNPNSILNFFQIAEDPEAAGTYFAVDAPEFETHASGRIISLAAPPSQAPDAIAVTYVTHPDTDTVVDDGDTPPADPHRPLPRAPAAGRRRPAGRPHRRDPGRRQRRHPRQPDPRYDFRIKELVQNGAYFEAGAPLLPGAGIVREIQYWDPTCWCPTTARCGSCQPVEIRSRPAPPVLAPALEAPEAQIFADEASTPRLSRASSPSASWRWWSAATSPPATPWTASSPSTCASPAAPRPPAPAASSTTSATCSSSRATRSAASAATADPDPGRRVLAQVMHDLAGHQPADHRPRRQRHPRPRRLDGRHGPRPPRHELAPHRPRRRPVRSASATGSPSSPARSASVPPATACRARTRPAPARRPTRPRPCAPCSSTGRPSTATCSPTVSSPATSRRMVVTDRGLSRLTAADRRPPAECRIGRSCRNWPS